MPSALPLLIGCSETGSTDDRLQLRLEWLFLDLGKLRLIHAIQLFIHPPEGEWMRR